MAGKYDLIYERLCYEPEEGLPEPPYPLDALYTLEGLNYIEVMELIRALDKGEPLPDWRDLEAGQRRREMARALGATEEGQDHQLASAASQALDRVAVAAKRIGVQLTLRGPRSELLSVATALLTSDRAETPEGAVQHARKLIAAVDQELRTPGFRKAALPSVTPDGDDSEDRARALIAGIDAALPSVVTPSADALHADDGSEEWA